MDGITSLNDANLAPICISSPMALYMLSNLGKYVEYISISLGKKSINFRNATAGPEV